MFETEEEKEKRLQKRFEEDLAKIQKEEDVLAEKAREEIIKLQKEEKIKRPAQSLIEKLKKAGSPEEILSAGLDTWGSLEFLKKEKKRLLELGYEEGPLMDTYLGLAVISRRIRISLDFAHKELLEASPYGQTENVELLSQLEKIGRTMAEIKKVLDKDREEKAKTEDIVSLHEQTLKEAEEFLKKHLGEFGFSKDKEILDMSARAHWAFSKLKGLEGEVPLVWSEEGAFLLKKNLISPEALVFILRTSPEGLKKLAEFKNEKLEFDLEKTEQALEKLREEFERK